MSLAEVAVKAGEVVKWKNEGAEAHTVTAEDGLFDSGSMASRGRIPIPIHVPEGREFHL